MKHILDNDGNKRYFKACARRGTSFTVNVWRDRNGRGKDSYDAGFYVDSEAKKLGEPSPEFYSCPKHSALILSNRSSRTGVAYRIRVWPKKVQRNG